METGTKKECHITRITCSLERQKNSSLVVVPIKGGLRSSLASVASSYDGNMMEIIDLF
jgi:hypothetical protein